MLRPLRPEVVGALAASPPDDLGLIHAHGGGGLRTLGFVYHISTRARAHNGVLRRRA